MATWNPLFLIGNKRSGTSHIVRLLILHPKIFFTHESDVVWILYQLANRKSFQCYRWDGPVGMEATLEACCDIIAENQDTLDRQNIRDLFLKIQSTLMKHGSKVQQRYQKPEMLWLGDKKPVQQVDPEIFPFILDKFPGAHFLHVIRHPQEVVSSMMRAGRAWANVKYWKDSIEVLLERWTIHEEWVMSARTTVGDRLLTVHFDELCRKPIQVYARALRFLGLKSYAELDEEIKTLAKTGIDDKHRRFHLPYSERARAVMNHYGFAELK